LTSITTSGKPIHLVEEQADLTKCIDTLLKEQALALDLEFDSHSYAYGVTLCLIQIASRDICYLIDPLADLDINSVYDLFENETIQKIVHSPGEDLRILHSLDCFPRNVFDTEVVAKLLNYEKTSLAILLQEKLGVEMNKKQQRSNWLKRPLSREQLIYAAGDVSSLHDLQVVLLKEASEKGIMPYVLEEQDGLTTTIYQQELKTTFLKPADQITLSAYDQYILNELFRFRDDLAKAKNKPAFMIMEESLLRSLADGSMLPGEVLYAKRVYGSLKTERFAQQLEDLLGRLQEEAQNEHLSRSRPERPRQSNEFRLMREQAERDKVDKFEPIQRLLASEFGEFTARFILSNGTVNDLLRRNLRLQDFKRNYKRELIQNAAVQAGIDISMYA